MLGELEFAVKLLEREGVNYMIGRGIAIGYWGLPRSTTDIDFVVSMFYASEKDALLRVEDELKRTGWEIKADAGRPLIAEKPTLRFDFWSLKSIYDKERFGRRMKVRFGGFDIWITAQEDLIIQKLMWYRSKDVDDIKGILARGGRLDREYIGKWGKEIGLEDKLESVQREMRD